MSSFLNVNFFCSGCAFRLPNDSVDTMFISSLSSWKSVTLIERNHAKSWILLYLTETNLFEISCCLLGLGVCLGIFGICLHVVIWVRVVIIIMVLLGCHNSLKIM